MRYIYPNGKEKALTFSYDDAQYYDRQLVEIFNKYGMKATFHLNSGTLGGGIFIQKEEVKDLYAGHEVAVHGVEHRNLPTITDSQKVMEIWEDRKNLEALTGKMVQGMSYAFGNYSPEIMTLLKSLGIKYSRTVNSTNGFYPPADFLAWHPTCHHGHPDLMGLGKTLLNAPDYIELPLMYVWGHSFEFAGENGFKIIEDFCELMTGKEDIWYATNMEICDYINAIRSLEYSADGKVVKNPTAITVFYKEGNEVKQIPAGATIIL